MGRKQYTPHNPRTAAMIVQFEEAKGHCPAWDDSLICCQNWRRMVDHKWFLIKMLARELQRLDCENNELREIVEHLDGGRELLTAQDNSWKDAHISGSIAHLDPDQRS